VPRLANRVSEHGLARVMPPGTTARAPEPEDLDAVVAVVAASEQDVDGEVDITTEDLRSDWQRPSFDLSLDAVVVERDGRIVAYAEGFSGRGWVHVHPDVRRLGIGAALLRWTEGRSYGGVGGKKLGQTVSDRNRAAVELLTTNGYRVRWHTWVFQKPLDEEPPAPALPEGITLRAFEPGRDDRATHELIDTAFSDWPDRDPGYPFEDWAASYIRRDDFDPTLTFLLEEDGVLVGVSLCQAYDDEGWVQQIAVERARRGRGLGGALLQASFREFFRRGLRTAGLSTESRSGARGVYEHVGMHVTRSYTRYSKDL
jgi:mycothiol synthase